MSENFSFRRDLCVNGHSETLELDGTADDVLRVLYALEQPRIVSPNLKEILEDLTKVQATIDIEDIELTAEEQQSIEAIVNKAAEKREGKQADESDTTE